MLQYNNRRVYVRDEITQEYGLTDNKFYWIKKNILKEKSHYIEYYRHILITQKGKELIKNYLLISGKLQEEEE